VQRPAVLQMFADRSCPSLPIVCPPSADPSRTNRSRCRALVAASGTVSDHGGRMGCHTSRYVSVLFRHRAISATTIMTAKTPTQFLVGVDACIVALGLATKL